MANTELIILNYGVGNYAAQIAANYQGDNFGDWYLPSMFELHQMYLNIGQGNYYGLGNIGNFADNGYWSSTEYDYGTARWKNFNSDSQTDYGDKASGLLVRAIRAF
jgi:hypothetical protein